MINEMFLLLLKGPSQPSAATYDGSVVGAVGGSTLCGSPGYFIYPLILVSVIAVSVDRIFFFFLSANTNEAGPFIRPFVPFACV